MDEEEDAKLLRTNMVFIVLVSPSATTGVRVVATAFPTSTAHSDRQEEEESQQQDVRGYDYDVGNDSGYITLVAAMAHLKQNAWRESLL